MPRLVRRARSRVHPVLLAALLAAGGAAATPARAPAQAAAAPAAAHDRVADFTLRDQFDRPHAVRFADAPLTLLVFSGRTTAREGGAWLRRLRPVLAGAPPAARVIEVAALGSPSRLTRPIVRRVFRGQAPIPLDWEDAVAAGFGYRAGAARVVLVDSAGRVRAAASGAPSEAAAAAFGAAIDGAPNGAPPRAPDVRPGPTPTAAAPAPRRGTSG
jgi:hypothetical protein